MVDGPVRMTSRKNIPDEVMQVLSDEDLRGIENGDVDFYWHPNPLTPPSPEEVVGFLYNEKRGLVVATPKRLYIVKPKNVKSAKFFAGSLAKEIRKRKVHEGVKQYGSFEGMMDGWLGEIERSDALMMFIREVPCGEKETGPLRTTETKQSQKTDKKEESSEGKKDAVKRVRADGISFFFDPEVVDQISPQYAPQGEKDPAKELVNKLRKMGPWKEFVKVAEDVGLEIISVVPSHMSPASGPGSNIGGSHILRSDVRKVLSSIEKKATVYYDTESIVADSGVETSEFGREAGRAAQIIMHELTHLITEYEGKGWTKDKDVIKSSKKYDKDNWSEEMRRRLDKRLPLGIKNMLPELRKKIIEFWDGAYREGLAVIQEKKPEIDRETARELKKIDLRRNFERDADEMLKKLDEIKMDLKMLQSELDKFRKDEKDRGEMMKALQDISSSIKNSIKDVKDMEGHKYSLGSVAMATYIELTGKNVSQISKMGPVNFWKDFRKRWESLANVDERRINILYKIHQKETKIFREIEDLRRKYTGEREEENS